VTPEAEGAAPNQGGPAESSGSEAEELHRYWHYIFVLSILASVISGLALLNGRYGFIDITSYDVSHTEISSSVLFAGYAGMFFAMAILPIPDYTLVPVYGFLCSIGVFDPFTTFIVCLLAALFPPEYVCGRLAARPLLLKGLRYFGISENDIQVAERWLTNHGQFSIFIATFIPFFYSVASLAAGTLKMRVARFFLDSAAGFGLRYAFLEYVGYTSVYVFSASFDNSHAAVFAGVLVACSTYVAVHLVRTRGLRTLFASVKGIRDIAAAIPH
jgi:membrane protein DedA with SNARE-associated domain